MLDEEIQEKQTLNFLKNIQAKRTMLLNFKQGSLISKCFLLLIPIANRFGHKTVKTQKVCRSLPPFFSNKRIIIVKLPSPPPTLSGLIHILIIFAKCGDWLKKVCVESYDELS